MLRNSATLGGVVSNDFRQAGNNGVFLFPASTKRLLFDLSAAATNFDTSKTKYLGIKSYSGTTTNYTLDFIDINANSDDVNNLVSKINSTA